ncbi:DUF2334 domain-containing protein [Desulfohalovibrio reitneri]|uniref:DUF2334 domain-containing protein n=1 Tax=Desulfohalovibrio reitneri TaxID=1307759 RepID=UPI0004A6BFAC|nr:DUF2334 domain-containing protein [Desulfohalovibrio reitneri]
MALSHTPCALYRDPPADLEARLEHVLDRAMEERGGPVSVFVRADDIGMPGRGFPELLDVFRRRSVPLALAVVPTWLPMRHRDFFRTLDPAEEIFCLHQHGFRHANTQQRGKKSEFGHDVPLEEKGRRIERGRDILTRYLGQYFHPLFTPPWNRTDAETLDMLARAGFRAVSRWCGEGPPLPPGMRGIPVNVDLHTRKEESPEDCLAGLLSQLSRAVSRGECGLMLHHQRMNGAAFSFLERLLDSLAEYDRVRFVNAREMI